MSTQSEDAILNVKINGQDAIATFTELNKLRTEQLRLVKSLNSSSPQYEEQAKKLTLLNTQYDAWKQKILGVEEAQSKFQKTLVKVTDLQNISSRMLTQLSRQLIGLATGFISVEIGAKAIQALIEKIENLDIVTGRLNQVKQNMAAINEVMKDADKDSSTHIVSLKLLYAAATDVNNSMQNRIKAAEELKKGYPDALSNASALAIANGQEKKAIDGVTTALLEQAKAQASLSTISKLYTQIQDAQWEKQKVRDQNAKELSDIKATGSAAIIGGGTGISGASTSEQLDVQQAVKTSNDNAKFLLAAQDENIQVYQRQIDFLEKMAGGASKMVSDLDKTNKLIQDPLKNFNAIIKASGDKDDIDALKAALQAKLDALAPNDKQIAVYQDKLRQVEKIEKQYAPKINDGQAAIKKAEAEKKAQAEAIEKQVELTKSLAVLNGEELASTKSTFDKEIEASKAKYAAFIEDELKYQAWVKQNKDLTPADKKKDIQASNKRIGHAQDDQGQAVNEIQVKQAKETSDAIKKYQDDQAANFSENLDKELQKNNDFYNELRKQLAGDDWLGIIEVESARIASNAKSTAAAALAEEKRYEDELQQLKDKGAEYTDNKNLSERAKIQAGYDKELQMFKDQLAKKEITQKQYDALIAQSKTNYDLANTKADEDSFKKYEDLALQSAEKVENTAFSIEQNSRESNFSAQNSQLEKERSADLNNINLTASQKAAINAKYDREEAALKLKKWQADHTATLEKAIIDTAAGVIKAIPNIPLEIEAGAEGAAQIAIIAAAKAPQFADGGILPQGPTHANGGLNVIDPLGRLVANIEGGEPIFSKKTAANNPNLVNALLGSGGQTLDYEKVLSANNGGSSLARRASGNGSTSSTYSRSAVSSPGQSGSSNLDRMEALHAQTMQMIQAVDSKQIVLSNRAFNDNAAKIAQIQDSVNG